MNNNIQNLLMYAQNELKDKNIETYKIDCQLLMTKAINKDKIFVLTNRDYNLNEEQTVEFLKLIKLRAQYMPVKYILGECEFMGLNFNVKPGVLIPRPDTEILVESIIEDIKRRKYKEVCDVCCGSGAIGISISHYAKECHVDCYDISDIACEVTKDNIDKFSLGHNATVQKSNLLTLAISENKRYDVIVSNPPYIKNEEVSKLMKDVKDYEPLIALEGGEDGLDFYRRISYESALILRTGGIFTFEIGDTQKNEVMNIMKLNGYDEIYCIKDLAGRDRVIKGEYLK